MVSPTQSISTATSYVCAQGYVSEVALDAAEAAAKIHPEVNSQRLFTGMGSRYVSAVALDAALTDASDDPAVNSRRLFTKYCSAVDVRAPSEPQALNSANTYQPRRRSAVDATAPSERQALNTPEHIPSYQSALFIDMTSPCVSPTSANEKMDVVSKPAEVEEHKQAIQLPQDNLEQMALCRVIEKSAFPLNKDLSIYRLKLSPMKEDEKLLTDCLQSNNLPNLVELDVSAERFERSFPMAGNFLQFLPKSLLRLNLQWRTISQENLEKGLATATQLRELNISATPISTHQFKIVPQTLVKFSCRFSAIDDATLIHIIRNSPSLQELDIANNLITGECLKYVPKTLSSLDCSLCEKLTDSNLEAGLKAAPHLLELNIGSTKLNGKSLQWVSHTLLTLQCAMCRKLTDTNLTACLKATGALEEINICSTNLSGECLQFAPKSLLKVQAAFCQALTDENLGLFLKKAEKLTSLNISTTKIDGTCFTSDLTSLLQFDCSSCSEFVKDAILSALSYMPNLVEANISHNRSSFNLSRKTLAQFPKTLTKIICHGYTKVCLEEARRYLDQKKLFHSGSASPSLTIEGNPGKDYSMYYEPEDEDDED